MHRKSIGFGQQPNLPGRPDARPKQSDDRSEPLADICSRFEAAPCYDAAKQGEQAMIAGAHAVLWVRQDRPGNDACRFADAEGGFLIDGSSTDAEWNALRYRIRVWDDGTTRRVRIGTSSRIFLRRAPDDTWDLNGNPIHEVTGAKDIHLGFTPATLTLPIRRLKLQVGEEQETLAASLDLAVVSLRPLQFVLRRTASDKYECIGVEDGVTSQLTVDAQGIVRSHAGHWIAQT